MVLGNLERDVRDITDRKLSTMNEFIISLTLHTEKLDYSIPYDHIKFVDNKRDYFTELTEKYYIKFIMACGDFIYDILSNRNNLEITIQITTIDGYEKPVVFEDKYKCILSNVDKNLDIPRLTSMPREVLNQSDFMDVDIECIPRQFEVLSFLPGNCNINNITLEDALYYSLQQGINKAKPSVDGLELDFAFNIIPPHNKLTYNKVSTLNNPHFDNITLLTIPTYLQEVYGLYNGGVGTFLQKHYENGEFKDTIYVYSLYGPEAYDDVKIKNKLSVYIPMSGIYDLSEGTFFRDGDVLKILGTTDSAHLDHGDDEIRTRGTEIVNVHPKSLLNRSAVTDNDDSVQFNQSKIIKDQTLTKLRDQTKNVVYAGVDGNLYKRRSDILIGSSITFEIIWNNGNYFEVYPGMPVCVLRETGSDGIIEYKGKVITTWMSFDKHKNTNIVKLVLLVQKTQEDVE